MLFFAWGHLQSWYLFHDRYEYLIFSLLFLGAVVLLLSSTIRSSWKKLPFPRILILCALFLLIVPWGELIRSNIDSSREDWSRQVFLQFTLIYASLLFFALFPEIAQWIRGKTVALLSFASSKNFIIWMPALLFFLFSSWIALIVFRQTPLTQDTAAHLFQAKIFSHFRLFAPAPPLPEFFTFQGDMLVIKDNRWFSMYPPGFAFLLALAMLLQCEFLLTPLMGALTVYIWTKYAINWCTQQEALLLGLLFVFSPFFFLMSSALMVHTPELLIASAIIYLCRKETEGSSPWRILSITLLLFVGMLVRGFSLLPLLAPILVYTCWKKLQSRSWALPAALVAAMAGSFIVLALFQWNTTGRPWLSGYLLEYPDYKYGFGKSYLNQAHTPIRGLENISNDILGLNSWLTGWYSGSLFFIIVFILFSPRWKTWDRLLFAGLVSLMGFYYFFIAQDLVFGPRFLFTLTPILLLMVARSARLSEEDPDEKWQPAVSALLILSFLSFIPEKLPHFIFRFQPKQNQVGSLKEELQKADRKKTLVFLDKQSNESFVNWNDPFLKKPAILSRDLGIRNADLEKRFPEYRPVYFRLKIDFERGKLGNTYSFYQEPDNKPPGYISLFALGMALQGGYSDPDRDFFDITYSQLLTQPGASIQMAYLNEQLGSLKDKPEYKRNFEQGIIHAGKMLLVPKVAWESKGTNWTMSFDMNQFIDEYNKAFQSFQAAGEVGKLISLELTKVARRMDRDKDGNFSQSEVQRFLTEKIPFLQM